MNEQMKQVLEVARSYVKLQNDAEGMFEGFGGRKPRPSDDDLRKVDEAIALLSQQAADHISQPVEMVQPAAAAGAEPVINDRLSEIRSILDDTQVEYHDQGMGCGLEDRGITDRYEAMRYGWDEAIDRMHDEIIKHAIDAIDELLASTPAEAQAAPVDGLSFEQIEDAFPEDQDYRIEDDRTGEIIVTPKWLHAFARNIAALSQQPAVRVPEEDVTATAMRQVAEEHAHGLALALECILHDYSGQWYDSAISKLSAYREAMIAIHERESPTFMGEPFLPKDQPYWIRNAKPPMANDTAPTQADSSNQKGDAA